MAYSGKEVYLNNVAVQFVLQELSDGTGIDEYDPVIEYLASKRSRPAELMGTARIANYVEETVPTYSDPLFRTHFRMTRTSFQALLKLVGPHITVLTISLEKRTLACLWYLSNQETFRGVADRFGLSKGSLHFYLENFCKAITGKELLPSLITWPDKSE